MEKECNRCGECCKVIPIHIVGLTEESIHLLTTKGVERDGDWFLFRHKCQHLTDKNICFIHDDKPRICRLYKGQKWIIGTRMYTPRGCVWRED